MFFRSFIETLIGIFSTLAKVPKRIPNYEKLFNKYTLEVESGTCLAHLKRSVASIFIQALTATLKPCIRDDASGFVRCLPGMHPAQC